MVQVHLEFLVLSPREGVWNGRLILTPLICDEKFVTEGLWSRRGRLTGTEGGE